MFGYGLPFLINNKTTTTMEIELKLEFDCSEERLSTNGNYPIAMEAYVTINGKRLYCKDPDFPDLHMELDFFEDSDGKYDFSVPSKIFDNREDFELVRILLLLMDKDLNKLIKTNAKKIYDGGMSGIYNENGKILEKTFQLK